MQIRLNYVDQVPWGWPASRHRPRQTSSHGQLSVLIGFRSYPENTRPETSCPVAV